MTQPTASPTAASSPWEQKICAVLGEQAQLVGRLVELARDQGELIRERRTDDLLTLLADRQRIIDRFGALQPDLNELTADLDARLAGVAPSAASRIRTLLGEIEDALGTVLTRDAADEADLRAGRDAIRRELTGVDQGRQARSAYLHPGSGGAGSRFADRKG